MGRRTAGLLVALAAAAPLLAKEPLVVDAALEEIPLVTVVTAEPLPHECLAPVIINRIDGENNAQPAQGFSLQAGVHSLNGKALLDTGKCRPIEADLYVPSAADLVMEFVAGNIYYLAYDRSYPDASQWRLVVWKVEAEEVVEPAAPIPADVIQ